MKYNYDDSVDKNSKENLVVGDCDDCVDDYDDCHNYNDDDDEGKGTMLLGTIKLAEIVTDGDL